jgi:thiamine biosynthesis lipoprotein
MAPAADLHTIAVGREAMGCRFEVVFNAGEVAEATELGCQALDLIDEIEGRISIYRPTSELAAVNAAAGGEWVGVSADTLALLEEAGRLHAATAGGFDIAAGPLVRSWGFLERRGRTPGSEELAAAVSVSGMRQVELDPAGRRVRLAVAGAALNPGAIGKGWAIDRAMEALRAAGVPSVLVHGGQSSVRSIGGQGSVGPSRGWNVGLRHPLRPSRRLATVTLVDRALGTSGSGTQFFVDRGRRLGHILDPRSGRPAEGVVSATVLAPSAAEADALATAAYVLGEEGLEQILAATAEVGGVLVLPGPGGGLRMIIAGLAPGEITVEPEPGLEVVWRPNPREPVAAPRESAG